MSQSLHEHELTVVWRGPVAFVWRRCSVSACTMSARAGVQYTMDPPQQHGQCAQRGSAPQPGGGARGTALSGSV